MDSLSPVCTFPSRTLFSRYQPPLVFSAPFSPFARYFRPSLSNVSFRVSDSTVLRCHSVFFRLPPPPIAVRFAEGASFSFRRCALSTPRTVASREREREEECWESVVGTGAEGLDARSITLREVTLEGMVLGDVVGASIVTVLNERPR